MGLSPSTEFILSEAEGLRTCPAKPSVGSVYSGELELEHVTLHSHVHFHFDVHRS
jgi:hypothetical protein